MFGLGVIWALLLIVQPESWSPEYWGCLVSGVLIQVGLVSIIPVVDKD